MIKTILLSSLAAIPATAVWLIGVHLTGYGVPFSLTVMESIAQVLSFSMFTLPLAIIGIVVFGLPIHWLLTRTGYRHTFFYVVSGTVIGTALGLVAAKGTVSYWLTLPFVVSLAVSLSFGLAMASRD